MVTRRDPFAELGLPPDASPTAVKAAWRRLAREHHPDLARDRTEERTATRRMARINAAYEAALRLAEGRRSGRGPGTATGGRGAGGRAPGAGGAPDDTRDDTRGGGRTGARTDRPDDDVPPGAGADGAARRARPVTRRVDTSALFHAPGARGGGGPALPGQPPPRPHRPGPEALRGAPGGPVERHQPRRPPEQRLPDLAAARAHVVPFGKFHDRSLGEVERVEPTYIDWIVRTIRRDPDLVAAARVVQAALDAAGVRRATRPDRSPDGIGADPEV